MTRTGLCCETLQLTLWNFCSDVPYDKNGPLLRNFATNFVKLLRWRALWQEQAIDFVKLLQWRALWQERAFASKLCNLICETFVVTCPLTRSGLCSETLQLTLWTFCRASPMTRTGLCWETLQLTLWNFCGDRPLLWNVHWCHWRNPSSLASLLYSFNHLDNQQVNQSYTHSFSSFISPFLSSFFQSFTQSSIYASMPRLLAWFWFHLILFFFFFSDQLSPFPLITVITNWFVWRQVGHK